MILLVYGVFDSVWAFGFTAEAQRAQRFDLPFLSPERGERKINLPCGPIPVVDPFRKQILAFARLRPILSIVAVSQHPRRGAVFNLLPSEQQIEKSLFSASSVPLR
jgi:hypothetical protein